MTRSGPVPGDQQLPRIGDLEIRQDLSFERRDWMMQRLGWAVIGLLILAGLTGLTGSSGPMTLAQPPALRPHSGRAGHTGAGNG
jgi:hypothetical protein